MTMRYYLFLFFACNQYRLLVLPGLYLYLYTFSLARSVSLLSGSLGLSALVAFQRIHTQRTIAPCAECKYIKTRTTHSWRLRHFPVCRAHPAHNAAALCYLLAVWLSFDGDHHRARISSSLSELRRTPENHTCGFAIKQMHSNEACHGL